MPCQRTRSIVPFLVVLLGLSLTTCSRQKLSDQTPSPDGPRFLSPVRLALQNDARLVVSDYGTDTVCTVEGATLAPMDCFAVDGKPLGVAWSSNRTFVGNETKHAVEVYDRAGALISTLPGVFTVPSSLAVDERNGLLFVLDGAAKTIHLLTLGGYPVGTITGDLSGDGQFVHPVAIAVDPLRQEVLVSDYGDVSVSFPLYPARIRIYDYAGTFIMVVRGSAGGFSRPQGIAVAGDHVFVTDSWLGQVLIFTRQTGTSFDAAGTLGSFGDGPGQLMLPLDTVVDPLSGDVFVTNNRAGRIERFAGGGLVP
jgi:DNA-binding beta-propeller fold protein YncE